MALDSVQSMHLVHELASARQLKRMHLLHVDEFDNALFHLFARQRARSLLKQYYFHEPGRHRRLRNWSQLEYRNYAIISNIM